MDKLLNWLLESDTQLFLYLNSVHYDWLDPIMAIITNRYTWFPAYLIFMVWLYFRDKKSAFLQIATILIAVLVADQICSSILKPLIGRLRPCHEPSLQAYINIVTGCGGKYGFCSSHAANAFALFTSVFMFFGRNKYTIILFVWAIIISYSRIYVGVHYPLDVIFGGIIGTTTAYLSFLGLTRAKAKYFQ